MGTGVVKLPSGEFVTVKGKGITSLESAREAVEKQTARDEANVVGFSKTAAAIRGVGGLGGFFGGPIGATTGFVSDILGQGVEKAQGIRREIKLAPALVSAGLGGIPGIPSNVRQFGPAARVAKQALTSGAISGVGAGLTDVAEGRDVSGKNILLAGGIGATLGGAIGLRANQINARIARQAGEPPFKIKETGGPPTEPLAPDAPRPDVAAATTEGEGIARAALTPPPRTLPPGVDPVDPAATPPEVFAPRLQEPMTRQAIDAAAKDLNRTAQALGDTQASREGKRLFQQLTEGFKDGSIPAEDFIATANDFGITTDALMREWAETFSVAGRQLGRLGLLQRKLNQLASKDANLAKALKKYDLEKDETFWERSTGLLTQMDDFTRASIIAQTATTMRNIETQAARFTLEVFDVAQQEIILGRGARSGAREMLSGLTSLWSGLKPASASKLARVLDEYPLEARRLQQLPGGEGTIADSAAGQVSLGRRYTKLINTGNTLQEQYFRRSTLDFSLRRGLRLKGIDPELAFTNPEMIPGDVLKDAVDQSLTVTFAKRPEKGLGKAFVNGWQATRLLSSPINPFPRFMVNAYQFLTDFSPAGYLKLFGWNADKVFADPLRRAQVLSRAQIGTMLLGAGMALRNDPELAGDKWYQFRLSPDGPLRDARALAPFSTYMFYGEVMRQLAERGDLDGMTGGDILQGVASLNRIAGTGLVALDFVTGRLDEKQARRMFTETAGQYLGRFTVPGRVPKDVLASMSTYEATLRSTRPQIEIPVPGVGDVDVGPLIGPALSNLPVASQLLPPSKSPLRSGIRRTRNPLARQLGAATIVERNPVERAVDRLAIDFGSIYPKTGIREVDDATIDIMGKLTETRLIPIVESQEFRSLPDFAAADNPLDARGRPTNQKIRLVNELGFIRRMARVHVKQTLIANRPDLFLEMQLQREKVNVKDALLEMGFGEAIEALR